MVSRIVDLFRGKKQDDHDWVQSVSSDYVDDDLDDEAVSKVDTHLEWCPPCRSFVNTLRATVGLLGSTPRETPPSSLVDRIREKIRSGANN